MEVAEHYATNCGSVQQDLWMVSLTEPQSSINIIDLCELSFLRKYGMQLKMQNLRIRIAMFIGPYMFTITEVNCLTVSMVFTELRLMLSILTNAYLHFKTYNSIWLQLHIDYYMRHSTQN